MASTIPSGGWFVTTLVFVVVGMLVDGAKTIICSILLCSSFILCCHCIATLSDLRTRRSCHPRRHRDAADAVGGVNGETYSVDVVAVVVELNLFPEIPCLFGPLPSFPYLGCWAFRGGGEEGAFVCTVCQSAIEEREAVVALPLCAHVFHVQCVEPWLKTHSTCPNCRACVSETTPTTPGTAPPELIT